MAVGARLEDTEETRVRGASGSITATTEAACYSLVVGDGLVAAVAHPHLELEAHERDGGAFGRTLAAHCLATLSAVVLRASQRANVEDIIG